jgi:hypothetical protein
MTRTLTTSPMRHIWLAVALSVTWMPAQKRTEHLVVQADAIQWRGGETSSMAGRTLASILMAPAKTAL